MEYFLSQIGLLAICAAILYIMWKVDAYLYEKNTGNTTLKSDSDSEDLED